ncbi:gliding motility-associated C-terminal domain-containing protein [Paracrocinitomix mangrovi]|uniref:T9SS type B sorting domain-containing protein n=1 Tax=Paracrocinitomix mangrovi TaxID=2862509 RepID=UPI001EDA2C84|nr:gliding motility-associated C-terminal domain-containing protein [Paracrocinitomix mangrovi]UKN00777.1 gliding motility-associated C-terminal domain-containing protein [Paracrocinitomix mangrovi]
MLIAIMLFISIPGIGQLDVKHYVPPLYGRTNVQDHYMILSTPSTGPVTVDVKNGQGTILYSTVITDVNPNVTLLGTGYAAPGIIATAELNTVNATDGFIIEASAPIYVNLRHVQSAQGLSLNSKGAGTGLGTHFRSGHIYSSGTIAYVKAHEISVMASEDNTTVTFSDISPGVIFRNTPQTAGTSDDITVTLNAGESYVIAAWIDEPGATNNINGVNGTLVTSNKPIACNTGSWLSGADGNLRDIGVDQIVPLDLVGQEYIFVEGDGNANTERPLVVAEYNNTAIYVNGSGTPIATINSGEYFYLPQTAYSANDNIYITTSQPAFMYQSLSGSSTAATSLNFIPPLRCNGFKKVVIPSVNLVGEPTVSITARANADVFVNGSATPLTGGLAVTGNSCWVTYKIPGGTGDFVVESDSIINVALLTLQGPRGSAGYFTGFTQFTQIDQGDTSSFIVCADSASSYVTYSIEGPYINVSANFHDPALNGQVIIDGFNQDTLFFTYIGDPNTIGTDTLDLTVCKMLNCCGAIPDTICETSTLVFTNYADINTGLGDSIVACADTADITLENLLLGTYDPGGYWVDNDNSGALFGNQFNVGAVGPGNYHFTYYVDGGSICYDSTVVTVNVLPMNSSTCCSIAPDFILEEPTCNGYTDGSIVISDIWATAYSIDGGTTSQAGGNFGSIGSSNYNVNLTFGPDCVYDTVIVINQPAVLSANLLVDSVSCNGLCDGMITANATGGTTPYLYALGAGADQSSNMFGSLCAGPATITLTDSNNCEAIIPTTVFQPNVLVVSEASHTDETCSLVNGEITVSTAGGTAPYTYTLNAGPSQSSPVFSNLAAGAYTIAVTDANGCTDDVVINIVNYASPNATLDSLKHVTCFGGFTGLAIVGISGGTSPITYAMDGGASQSSNMFNSILAGPHEIVVSDLNGCTDTVAFTITEPPIISWTHIASDALCNGVCDGEIEVSASGGTPGYMYSDDGGLTFQSSNVLDNLCAGLYNVVVKDTLGCLSNGLIVINEPPALTSTQSFIDPICHQTPTGEISFTATGGTGAYEYSVDGGATYVSANPVTTLMAGVYDVIVKDANGCEFPDQITLTDPPPFSFSFVANNPSNCGANDGSFEIVVDPNSGTPPFWYSIDGGNTTQFLNGYFQNLYSGLYTLQVEDALGCVDSVFSALSDNVMTTQIDFVMNATCNGSTDGGFIVNQQFGQFPFSYTLNTTGQTQPFGVFAGLGAGQYFVTIEDNGLCIGIQEVIITEPDTILFDETATMITCPEGTDGTIEISNVTGGDNGPYNYSIDNGANYFPASQFTNLSSGVYDLMVQDAMGCLGGGQIEITEPDTFEININSTNLVCNNDNTGFIQVVADGATPPYTFTVAGNNTTGVFTLLPAGVYPITITDDNGCTFDTTQTLTEPPALTLATSWIDPLCYGSADGSIIAVAGGGTPGYIYSPDNGNSVSTSNQLGNLADGCYDVYVQDANGCNITLNTCLTQPTQLSLTYTTSPETCSSDNGEFIITASNGTPNYVYSNNNGTSFQAANNFDNLDEGDYNVVLEDDHGCQLDTIITIVADPEPQIDNVSAIDPDCFGNATGSLTVTSSSGVGTHQYSITSAAGPYQLSNVFNGLTDGIYNVFVTDDNGCVATTIAILTQPSALVLNYAQTNLSCYQNNTGQITFNVSGGTLPYDYSIDNGTNWQSVSQFPALSAATYDLMVEDGNGCQAITQVNITEPNPLVIDQLDIIDPSCYGYCDGSVTATVSGGTIATDYTFTWNNSLLGTVGNSASNVCDGTYSLDITDDNGCSVDTLNFVLTEPIQAVIDSVQITGVTCFGDIDGQVTVYSATAGFYSLGAGFTANNQFNSLPTNSYMAYVQDANGCPGDSAFVFVPTPQPLEGFVTPDQYICYGDSVFFSVVGTGGTIPYTFSVNNGASSSETIFEPFFTDSAFYVTITDDHGCTFDTDTMYIYVAPPPVLNTANDTMVCLGAEITLFSEADDLIETYLYDWSNGDTIPYIYPTINSDTTFYVTVTDECGLSTEDSITVLLHIDPIVSLTPDTTSGCPPFQINYTIGVDPIELGSDLIWTSTYGDIDSATLNNLYVTYTEPGSGDLILNFNSQYGCPIDTSFVNLVSFYGVPVSDFEFVPNPPSIFDQEVDLINLSTDNVNNTWYYLTDTVYTEHTSIPIELLPDIDPLQVCLIVENNFGCKDTSCQDIIIDNEQLLYVPNAIILDGYSDNSVFKPVTNFFHPDFYHLYIFNRWGELIFETEDLNQGWDGTYNGVIVQDGVYIWRITGTPLDNDSDMKEFYGHVTVLR